MLPPVHHWLPLHTPHTRVTTVTRTLSTRPKGRGESSRTVGSVLKKRGRLDVAVVLSYRRSKLWFTFCWVLFTSGYCVHCWLPGWLSAVERLQPCWVCCQPRGGCAACVEWSAVAACGCVHLLVTYPSAAAGGSPVVTVLPFCVPPPTCCG